MENKLSIISTVYNGEEYLDDFFQSVVNQTYSSWELIVIDDGSTDKSGKICDEYKEKYKGKIKVFHICNKGSLLARREGIAHVSGGYVYFADSDDRLINTAVAEILEAFAKYDTDAVFFTCSMDDNIVISMPFPEERVLTGDDMMVLKKYILTQNNNYNPLWTKAWKRSVLDKDNSAFYEEHRDQRMGTDMVQLLPLIDRCKSVVYLGKALYWYRVSPEGITWKYKEKHFEYIRFLGQYRIKYAEKWGIPVGNVFSIGKWEIFACVKHLYERAFLSNYAYIRRKLEDIENDEYFKLVMRDDVVNMKSVRSADCLAKLLRRKNNFLIFFILYWYRIFKG